MACVELLQGPAGLGRGPRERLLFLLLLPMPPPSSCHSLSATLLQALVFGGGGPGQQGHGLGQQASQKRSCCPLVPSARPAAAAPGRTCLAVERVRRGALSCLRRLWLQVPGLPHPPPCRKSRHHREGRARGPHKPPRHFQPLTPDFPQLTSSWQPSGIRLRAWHQGHEPSQAESGLWHTCLGVGDMLPRPSIPNPCGPSFPSI